MQIRGQKSLEMPSVEDDDVIRKRAAKATGQAVNIDVLPGRGRRRDDFIDTERLT